MLGPFFRSSSDPPPPPKEERSGSMLVHIYQDIPQYFSLCREQTEGEYSAIEHESVKGVVECLKVVTAHKSHRIAKFAFDYATRHGRKKVRN